MIDRTRRWKAFLAGAGLAVTLIIGWPLGSWAQAPVSRTAPSAPVLDAARAAFENLPEADRKALQDALIWASDYSGVADGTFGRQTFDAIVSLQMATKKVPNGILSPWDRTALQDFTRQAKDTVGFTIVDDPRSGVRVGVPTKFLPKQDANSNGGSRWQSLDGKVTLDTRIAPPDTTLQMLYDRNVAIRTAGRVVTYKILRPDFFVIAGETPTGKFYSRYAGGPEGIRAFSIGYDKTLAPQVDRFVVAIANSFTPFPTTSAAPMATASDPAPTPQAPPPVPETHGARLIGTGLVVGARQIMTTSPVETCKDVRVLGLEPRQVRGKGAYILDFAEDLKAKPATFIQGGMAEGSPLLILAFADEGSGPGLTAVSGLAVTATTVTAPLQSGASGAPVFDDQHRLVGLVGSVSANQRRIAGMIPAASYGIVPVSDLSKAFPDLHQSHTEPAAQRTSAADLVVSLKGTLMPVTCAP